MRNVWRERNRKKFDIHVDVEEKTVSTRRRPLVSSGWKKNLRCSKYVENYATRGLSSGELEQNMAEKRSEEMSKMMSPIKNPMKKPFWSGEGGRRRRKKALSYHDGSSAGKEDDSYTLFFLVEEGRWQNGRCILRLDNFAGKESGK